MNLSRKLLFFLARTCYSLSLLSRYDKLDSIIFNHVL
ncbi:hypothetical protein MGL_2076 [Malassezia globosa CBS 7966]|uniref:Uncharacterized protein n=1 Tax=Malassezia globosa (strain ATCC MYA-4612 / CBS 7966) TaxID=425265 RepID=A8Q0S7_MALGO|nr:uncharacterized protein MGL_2076 [Malassezia globosa CBS 7966]EDP43863.1 hypothetical protein MGL_2076 [Malassezia globosa CBS 7966]